MVDRGYLVPDGQDFALSGPGEDFMDKLGIDLAAARKKRRAFARQCIDWSEREPHLGGALGASLLARLFDEDWLDRVARTRRVVVTPAGDKALEGLFAVSRYREGLAA